MKAWIFLWFSLMSSPVVASGFDEAPVGLSLGLKALIERLHWDAELRNEACDPYDGTLKGLGDGIPGTMCDVTLGSVDLYAVGTDAPPVTRLLQMICVREHLQEDCKAVLKLVIAYYDPQFVNDNLNDKLNAFFNTISKQPQESDRWSQMRGVSATYAAKAFIFKFQNQASPVVHIRVEPKK